MALFDYIAMNREGNEVTGQMEGTSVPDVVGLLRQRGLFSVEVVPAGESKIKEGLFSALGKSGLFSPRIRKIKPQDLVIFTRQLAVLIEAGLSLIQALRTLKKQARFEAMSAMVGDLVEIIESGRPLSDALSQYPGSFSKVYINIVKAGETGGALDKVLKRLADYLERNLKLQQKISSALIYPALVLIIAVVILGIIITFVIPNFMELFKDVGAELPWLTQLVLNITGFLRVHWYLLLGGVGLLGLAYKLMLRNYKFRYFKDSVKLNVPVFGILIKKITAARFARTLATLISGGVQILGALELTKEISENEVMTKAIGSVYESVREGGFIAKVLENSGVFPQLMVDMIAVGEESGSLDKMLAKVSDTYEEEVEITANSLTSLLEPMLIITMGVVVGIIVLAMFLPLITLIKSLTG
ncbi:MAG: type II secretion system F family protein [PVC group bacterium]|nr:type II secretion system F family protein [PVC group bacterium]